MRMPVSLNILVCIQDQLIKLISIIYLIVNIHIIYLISSSTIISIRGGGTALPICLICLPTSPDSL